MPGFEGHYEVSDEGGVRSIKRGTPHLLRPSVGKYGHRQYSLSLDGRVRMRSGHSLVAEVFIGPRPEGTEVRHLDGDATNNLVTNLAYGTHLENMRDRLRHGTNTSANKTHCPRGHAYDEANTYRAPGRSTRDCRACRRQAVTDGRARRRSA